MVIIAIIISLFFVVMICMIGKAYYDDIIDIEDRLLQLEKRITKIEKISNEYKNTCDLLCENLEVLNIDTYNKLKEYSKKYDRK